MLDELLAPGESIVWSDRARARPLRALGVPPRSPAELGRLAALALLGALGVGLGVSTGHGGLAAGGLAASSALGLVVGLAIAARNAARYAITDRGRGLVALGGETIVFALPTELVLRADPDLETGDLDLGERAVTALPDGREERRAVVLRGVSYPTVVRDLVLQVARGAGSRPEGDGADAR